MTKFSVKKNGKPLDKSLYTWNESTKTFSSKESGLVLDFKGINGVTFRTGHSVTFRAGNRCIFKTGSDCKFKTGSDCTFKTGYGCVFKTGCNCTFTTGNYCFITRFDVEGVTEVPIGKTIKLNDYGIAGYTIIEKKKKIASCVGKIVEIDGKKYKLVKA